MIVNGLIGESLIRVTDNKMIEEMIRARAHNKIIPSLSKLILCLLDQC